ncbi:MAG: type II secretion system F family protein [Victivallales bacterium]|nr:type II secretion system F family protein [Victivallales bacterium]
MLNSTLITYLASISAGIATTCLMLLLINFIRGLEIEKNRSEDSRSLPLFFKLILPLTPNVIKLTQGPSFDQTRDKLQQKLQMSGFDLSITPDELLAIKIIYAIMGFIFMFYCAFVGKTIIGIIFFAMLVIYPVVWLKTKVQRRHLQILKALPNVLDLLTLSVEAGRDFMTALRDILARRKRDAIGEELDRTFKEIQIGKPRTEALRDLGRRVQLPDLTTVLNAIIQAEELGVSIAELLKIQGDLLRNKRFSRAEKLANEAPVKILMPMILFIFPAVFIILMAPMILHAMKTMFQ